MGQFVWYYYHPASIGKLARGWLGPVKIVGRPTDVNATIKQTPSAEPKRVHIDHLKPYWGPEPEGWETEEGAGDLEGGQEVSEDTRSDDGSAEQFRRSGRQRRAPERLDL